MFNNIILSVMAWTTNTVGGFANRLKEERGQDILEYAILAGGIALALGFALWALAGGGLFDDFIDEVEACITFDSVGCGVEP